jgi:arsenical pump membrane protein
LFILLFLTGAVLTLVLSNDATAIVLTPIVYRAIAKRGGDAMPFLFGCTFVADTASFGLPFANPANVIILPNPRLLPYLIHLGPPQIVAIGANLALFLLLYRSQLRGRYELATGAPPSGAVLRTLLAMASVGVAYVIALALRWPLGPVAAIGACVTLAIAFIPPRSALRRVSWSTFALLAGLFALLDAVARAGFVTWALQGLESVSRFGNAALDAASAGGAALFSNVLNNLPVAIASSYVVRQMPTEHLAYPLIVGVDLGPNLTTTGSLATILWLTLLRERGVHVNAFEYFKLGAVVVPTTIAVTVAWLWLVR